MFDPIFEAGDIVFCINNGISKTGMCSNLTVGKAYTITSSYGSGLRRYVRIRDNSGNVAIFLSDRFVLASNIFKCLQGLLTDITLLNDGASSEEEFCCGTMELVEQAKSIIQGTTDKLPIKWIPEEKEG